ncbi:MAG: SPASM domain-containing protein [Butyrivibrio sp.]|nr:SPASM domain-containing protein [Butyrivibrio sp.]
MIRPVIVFLPAPYIENPSVPQQNTAPGRLIDEKCRECVWLPICAGGCPVRRIVYGNPQCIEFRDNPERFILELYQHYLKEKKKAIAT